jgi:hypothetical protein
MSPEAIKKQWADAGKDSAARGTRLHLDIEHISNAAPVGNVAGDGWTHNPGPGWDYFLTLRVNMRKDWVLARGLEPYRAEWGMYDEEHALAGRVDMVFQQPDGSFAIYDWKRAKELKKENSWENGLGPASHLPSANYCQYSLQLKRLPHHPGDALRHDRVGAHADGAAPRLGRLPREDRGARGHDAVLCHAQGRRYSHSSLSA